MYLYKYTLICHIHKTLHLYKNNLRMPSYVPVLIVLSLGTTDMNPFSFMKTTLHHTVYSPHTGPG